jgi:ABC-2 type transport system ATP-binding protein
MSYRKGETNEFYRINHTTNPDAATSCRASAGSGPVLRIQNFQRRSCQPEQVDLAGDLSLYQSAWPGHFSNDRQKARFRMIRVEGLKKTIRGNEILKGINLNVKNGEIYGFIGHNGAGKSTTMNILTGLSKPTAGSCEVNGIIVETIKTPGDLQIGFLPEEPRFLSWLTAYETLDYLGNQPGKKAISEMLAWSGLEEAANRRVGGFSRGMKQRLGIGAALIGNPDLLILDEPSSALDPEGRAEVLALIMDLKKMGKTVLFSSHILSDVERVCDTVGMIANGVMIFEKSLSDMKQDFNLPIIDVELYQSLDRQLVQELNKIPGVEEVGEMMNGFSITCTDGVEMSKQLMGYFSNRNVGVRSLAVRENRLEDLFLREGKTNEA